MLIHIVGSRILSYQAYAQFTLAVSVTVVVQLLLTTGLPKTFAFLANRHPESALYLAKRGCLIALPLSLLIFFIFSGICYWIGGFHGTTGVLIVAALGLPPTVIFFTLAGILNGLYLFTVESYATSVYYVSRAILISLLLFATVSVYWGISGNTLAGLGAALLAFYLIKRNRGREDDQPVLNLTGTIKTFGIPTTIYGILIACIMAMDLWIANQVIGDSADRAVFACAHTISRFLIYAAMGLSRAIFPPLVGAVDNEEYGKTQNILSKSFLLIEFTVLPFTVAIFLYPGVLIQILYPGEYLKASALLPYLAGARLSISFMLVITAWWMAAKKMNTCIIYSLIGSLFVLSVSCWGYRYMQESGLAAGYFLACLLLTAAATIHTFPKQAMRLWASRNFLGLITASGICWIFHYLFEFLSGGAQSFAVQLTGFAIIVLIYPSVAYAFGVLKAEDFNFVRYIIKNRR
jgi:O-antigen/teichoic acid export membrane protein